jgi:hypothetical protein
MPGQIFSERFKQTLRNRPQNYCKQTGQLELCSFDGAPSGPPWAADTRSHTQVVCLPPDTTSVPEDLGKGGVGACKARYLGRTSATQANVASRSSVDHLA